MHSQANYAFTLYLSQLMVKICYNEIWSFVALRVCMHVCAPV